MLPFLLFFWTIGCITAVKRRLSRSIEPSASPIAIFYSAISVLVGIIFALYATFTKSEGFEFHFSGGQAANYLQLLDLVIAGFVYLGLTGWSLLSLMLVFQLPRKLLFLPISYLALNIMLYVTSSWLAIETGSFRANQLMLLKIEQIAMVNDLVV